MQVPETLLLTDGRYADLSMDTEPLCPLDGSGAFGPIEAYGPEAAAPFPASAEDPVMLPPAAGAPAEVGPEDSFTATDRAENVTGGTFSSGSAGGTWNMPGELLPMLLLTMGVLAAGHLV
jgi:hypothetical protein